MVRRKGTYCFYLLIPLAGLLCNSCAASHMSAQNTSHSDVALPKNEKDMVVQLKPDDCPWNRSFAIKKAPKHKEYGPGYAAAENRRLKDALN